jgi:hypothetical protein
MLYYKLHNHFCNGKAELEADPEAEAEAVRVEAEALKILALPHHCYPSFFSIFVF